MNKNDRLHALFNISVVLKGINGVAEILAGIFAFFMSQRLFTSLVTALTRGELLEDPRDYVSQQLLAAASHFSLSGRRFAVAYLLSHGLIKIFLVVGLLKKKPWAYPAALVFLLLFIIYQLYRYSFTHSVWMIALSIFDLLVFLLILQEYRRLPRLLP